MAAAKAFDEEHAHECSVGVPNGKISTISNASDGEVAPSVVGPYLIGVQLTRKERFAAWYGVLVMFFVVLVPTVNSTILAYFTKQLKADCGLTIAQYGLLSGYANGIVYACASLALGWAVDRHNWPRTYVMSAAYLLLAGMYVVEGLASSFGELFASVMIGAVGSSVHLTLSVSLVSDLLPPERVSLGQAIIFTGEAVAVVLGGNIAYAFAQAGITWRAAPLGLAVAAGVLAPVVGLTIKEPPKGRFMAKAADEPERSFKLGSALAYVANMRIFWLLTLGLGIRMNAGHLVLAYMPPFQQAVFPSQLNLSASFASVVGVCAFVSSLIIGAICEVQVKKGRPWMALYTAAYGGMAGCLFFLVTLWARNIAGGNGYGLMLACMGLGALCANGATGPLAALATLVLPPELKSFALSLYEFLTGLLAPSYSVFMGIVLQAVATKQTRAVDTGVYGNGPAGALEGVKKTLIAAQVFLAVGIIFSLFGAAGFFLAAKRGVLADIRKVKEWGQASSHDTPERVPKLRKVAMLLGLLLFAALILFLLTLSLIASFAPQSIRHQQS